VKCVEEWLAVARAVKFLGMWDSLTIALLWWIELRVSRLEDHSKPEED